MAEEIRELSCKLNEAIGLINTQTQRLQSQQDTLNAQAQRLAELENQNVQQDPAPPEHVPSGSIKPTFFRGGFHPTFTEWLEAYEEIAVCNNWKEEQKLNNLAYYLKDGAKTALKEVPEADKKTYNKVIQHLTNALEPVEKAKFYSALLYSPTEKRVQQPGEQVATFASEIKKIVLGAHPLPVSAGETAATRASREKERDSILTTVFTQGLLDHIKEKVLDAEPETFAKALEIANKAEARALLRKNLDPTKLPANPSFQLLPVECNNDQTDVNALYQPHSSSRFTTSNITPRKTTLTCNYCKKPGHLRKDCFSLRNKTNTKPKVSCNYCKKSGHEIKDCFSLKRNTQPASRTPYDTRNTRGRRPFSTRRQNFRPGQRNTSVRHRVNATESVSNESLPGPSRHQLQKQLEEFKQDQKELEKRIEARFNTVTQYAILPGLYEANMLTSDFRDCDHDDSDWENIPQLCKDNLKCLLQHDLNQGFGNIGNCVEVCCPTLVFCTTCLHKNTCLLCKNTEPKAEFVPQQTNQSTFSLKPEEDRTEVTTKNEDKTVPPEAESKVVI